MQGGLTQAAGETGVTLARRSETRKGDWLVLFSAACFSTMPIFGTLAYGAGIQVVPLLAWRFLLSMGLLIVFLSLSRRFAPLPREKVLGFLGMGAGYLAMSFLYFHALKLAPVSTLTLLFYTYPAIVTLLAAVLLRETLTRRKVLALGLALSGCMLVLRPSQLGSWKGAAMALAAAVMYSAFMLVGTRLTRGTDAVLATTWILSVSALGYTAAALWRGQMAPPTTLAAWGPIAGIAGVATVLSDVTLFWALPRTGASRAAILSTLEPVCTLVLAALLLDEAIPAARFGGGALILTSVLLIHWE